MVLKFNNLVIVNSESHLRNHSTLCDIYITDQQTTLFGLPDTENLKIITVHADPEDSMPPSIHYCDKAKYDGKIDQ